ncbi:lipopolysaccharide biosynthesis protein [Epibacterium ulvae]|uniref:lipopolysaccharide biosynthesis protein n=1 Tax=Epibacterium ulvae TaxID=1156985 RepID=UPI0024904418|nr:oligosaccharide flippase family protein [Epibacterium ulvae]
MISSVFIVLALRIVGMLLWLLTTLLLARLLPVAEFALTSLAINIILLFGALATLGAEVPVLRFGSSSWRDGQQDQFRGELRQGKQLALFGGLIAVLFMGGLLRFEVLHLNGLAPLAFMAIGFGILISGQIVVQRTALRSAGRVGEAVFAESFLRSFITLFLVGGAALLGQLSFGVALTAYLSALLIGWMLQLRSLSKLGLPRSTQAPVSSRVKFALSVWPGDAALVAFQRLPGVLIGFVTDLETAAVFLAAERVAQAGMFLIDAVRTVIGPTLAAAKEGERQQAISKGSAIMLGAGLVGALCTLAFGALFVHLLGNAYTNALPLIAILLIGQLSFTALGPTGIILNMYGQGKIRSLISVCSTTALCFVLLFVTSDIYHVALMYSAMIWIMNLLLALAIWRRLGRVTGLFSLNRTLLSATLKEVLETLTAKLRSKKTDTLSSKSLR